MSSQKDVLKRYKELRQVGRKVNSGLPDYLAREDILKGARELGLLGEENVLRFETGDEASVLIDYCIHAPDEEDRTAVDKCLTASPPPADSDEMVFLQAMAQSRFSIFKVTAKEPGLGVRIADVFTGDEHLLHDVAFSESARIGYAIATRLVAPEGLTMTTGAALPVDETILAAAREWMEGFKRAEKIDNLAQLSREQMSVFAAEVIRTCLERGTSAKIAYVDVPQKGGPTRPPTATAPPESAGPDETPKTVGRNDPCPCGSGLKFKKCCGKSS